MNAITKEITKQEELVAIIQKINRYIADCNSSHRSWYIGITDDPERRLFQEHRVNRSYGQWLYINTSSDEVARQVEKYFLDSCPIQGGPSGGSKKTTYVYAYKITYYTDQHS